MNQGWIKVNRKVREHWIWNDPVKFQQWMDILLEVNHQESQVNIGNQMIDCKRGQSVRSLQGWAYRWRISKGGARLFLNLLQKNKMITTENLNKTTRLTVCNYDIYQDITHDKKTQDIRKVNDSLTPIDPNNNINNENNEKVYKKARNFYSDQLAVKPNNKQYAHLVDFIQGNNDLKRPLYSILALRDQLTVEQFDTLLIRVRDDKSEVKILDCLLKIENDKKYTKGKVSLFAILLNWITKKFIK